MNLDLQKRIDALIYHTENDELFLDGVHDIQKIINELELNDIRIYLVNLLNSTFIPMNQLGTYFVSIGDGKDIAVEKIIRYAKYLIEHLKVDKQYIGGIKWDELPDLMTEEEIMRITGWTATTLSSKRSRGEIAFTKKPILYPKNEFKVYLESGMFVPPELQKQENYDDAVDGIIRKNRKK